MAAVSIAAGWQPVVGNIVRAVALALISLTLIGTALRMLSRRRRLSLLQATADDDEDAALAAYRAAKFQQTLTTGLAASLKLPLGAQLSRDAKFSLAQVQMTLPEVIDQLRALLRELGRRHTVVIGVDELDKMSSSEEAERFLNGVKGMFGIPGCFFLLSVSEDALSAFERRGLPMRDAFDSSLDAVLYVEHLRLVDTQRLLRRRAVGMPPGELLSNVVDEMA